MAIFQDNGKNAWAALHRAIVTSIQGAQETTGLVVQPLQTVTRADWDTPSPLLNMFREQFVANQAPTWNAVYFPNTGVNVPDEYLAFLDQLNAVVVQGAGGANPARLRQLDAERRTLQDKLQRNEYRINKEWDRYVANHRGKPPLSRPQWETDFGFAATRIQYRSEVEAALAAYMREVTTAGGDLLEVGRALSALGDPRQRVPMPRDEDDLAMPSDNWELFYRAGLSENLRDFLDHPGAAFDLTSDDAATKTDRFEERWSGGLSVSFLGFFGASGGASNETIRSHAETETGSISIHYDAVQSFAVQRGSWFKAGLISRFRDRLPAGSWGEGGRLNLIPATVVVGKGARIKVTTSTTVTDYYFNKRTAGGDAGFSIGPFRIGGGGGRTTVEESYEMVRTGTGFELTDTSGRGQIIAVASIRNADLLTTQHPTSALFRLLEHDEALEARSALLSARLPESVVTTLGVTVA